MTESAIMWLGIIAGTLVGAVGAAVGIAMHLRSCRTQRERNFVIMGAVVMLVFVGVFVAGVLLLPPAYTWLPWIPYPILLIALIVGLNRRFARPRQASPPGRP